MKRASFQMYLAIIFLTLLGSSLRANDFEPHVRFDGQLFPSFIISTAAIKPGAGSPIRLMGSVQTAGEEGSEETPIDSRIEIPQTVGDQNGLIGVEITPNRSNLPVTVTVTCDEVMEPSTFSGQLAKKGQKYLINPKIRYKFSKLAEVNQATPLSMHFKVTIGGKVSEDTMTVMLRPINDCPLVTVEYGDVFDTSSTFAAYVNEQHPFIDKLLREALDIGVVTSFTGYQRDEKEVIRQVYAIWDALVTRDIRYSSITATAGGDGGVLCQHVRLIEESLNNSQANCVDGSVLMASALRKIGIEPFLVTVPGHCYVGFFLDSQKKFPLAIETTRLGNSPSEEEMPEPAKLLEQAIDEDHRYDESWPSFQIALAEGTEHLLSNKEKFESADQQDYMLIHIANARTTGFLPIAFHGKEEFVSNGLVWDDEESDEEMMEEEAEEGDDEAEEGDDDESEDEEMMEEESDDTDEDDEDEEEESDDDDEESEDEDE